MIDRIIQMSLSNRLLVCACAVVLFAYGVSTFSSLPIDVLPNLNRPVVSILTEAPGLAPEEVENQISFPIESVLNGAPGVYRVRSAAIPGLSLVWADFDWESDVYKARQIVTEKLQQASTTLPPDINPVLGPISSIMGEIMLIGITVDSAVTPDANIREIADWILRPRLLAISGVSQVSVIGGDVKQYHVVVDPEKLISHKVALSEVEDSLKASNDNSSGGYIIGPFEEQLTRTLGRFQTQSDIENSLVHRADHEEQVLQVKHLAQVKVGGPLAKRGDAGVNGQDAVILTIQKQPEADTVALTSRIQKELNSLKESLPKGVQLHDSIFRQSRFINLAVSNVQEVLRDGAILVTLVLFMFLLSFRTTIITLTAIPLSITFSLIFFRYLGLSINTMTLGGLAIAIGELVDDAIVDVENIFRRLRGNRLLAQPKPALQVVYEASREVRGSIVFATFIVILVFIPLFAMTGIEGRLFRPIGYAYVTSILGSLIVALTVTPVLASYLLPKMKLINDERDSLIVRTLKSLHKKGLEFVFRFKALCLAATTLFLLSAIILGSTFGKEFLPSFNEGAFTVSLLSPPGTSLPESNRLGKRAEQLLLELPEVTITGRRVGRAENDEHAQGVNSTEIEGEFRDSRRTKAEILAEIRAKLGSIPGTSLNVGQPISHRIDHLVSGVRSQLAIKIFGTELAELRGLAEKVREVASSVPGIVDLYVEKQILVPQIHIRIDREQAALLGLTVQEISETLETALNGRVVTRIIEEQRTYDVVLHMSHLQQQEADTLRRLPIILHNGSYVPLEAVATIEKARGPNTIARENTSRRIVVSANVADRDLVSTVKELQNRVHNEVTLPEGYFISYGGQFESQARASSLIYLLGSIALIGIFLVLYLHYQSINLTLQVMLAVPFSFIGAIFGVYLSGGVLSIASLVGLITLTGIATRNGILLIDHYLHLMTEEGEEFSMSMIYRGASERLVPVLMTALTAILALTPILLGAEEPGKEILVPVAVVIFSGLFSSTFLNLLITPLVFWQFGRPSNLKQRLSES
ncbi:MAG: efflux RND transporter permease subunit [Bdellovibrionales bacterium]|nr:efflux RND transporter permease subunit [Bdellovibrionales bacterium]